MSRAPSFTRRPARRRSWTPRGSDRERRDSAGQLLIAVGGGLRQARIGDGVALRPASGTHLGVLIALKSLRRIQFPHQLADADAGAIGCYPARSSFVHLDRRSSTRAGFHRNDAGRRPLSQGRVGDFSRHEGGVLIDELSLEDESYAMANLSPRMTGLSRHVFVSPRMGNHDLRIKVSVAAGKNTLPVNCAVIALRPSVHHAAGPALPPTVMVELGRWASLNLQALVAYWDGDIDTGELLAVLQRI